MPGRVIYTPYEEYHSRCWNYYNSLYRRIEEPGYYTETTRYFWENNFYDLSTNQLLFSVQTQSFGESNVDKLAHGYGMKFVQTILRNHVAVKPASVALRPS